MEPSTTSPLVSICIPVYNAEATIEKTLESVTGQSYKNLEIIVVDNLSTDATLEKVRSFADDRIRIVENPVHFPCAEDNWNTCFAHAHGAFIALFHADDMYAPGMVEKQVRIFEQFPAVNGVFTCGEVIDEEDRVTGTLGLPKSITGSTEYTCQQLLPAVLESDNFFLCPGAMIRSNIYKKLAPFRYEQFKSASDLDLWLRAAKTGPVVFIDERLLKYRVSRNQWSYRLRLQTEERDFFRVTDAHLEEEGAKGTIPDRILARYELRKMEDQVLCAMNFLKKHDTAGFRQLVKRMPWGTYTRIIVTRPGVSVPVLFRGCFKALGKVRQ